MIQPRPAADPAASVPQAEGFVLAGGRSSRMGSDKAQLLWGGQPLVWHALGILRNAGLPASIAGGDAGLRAIAPLVEDRHPGQGPLSGICSALGSTTSPLAVFLPVDLPLLPSSLIGFLVRHAMQTSRLVTVASVNGFPQTFPVVLDRAALPALERELGSGRRGCFAGFQAAAGSLGQPITPVPVEVLVQCGQAAHSRDLPAARWFLNVNAPEDLCRAERLSGSPIA